jgi:uncharacterized protein YceH (UPF0502 family)
MATTQPGVDTLIRDRISSLEDEVASLRERLDTVLAPASPTAVEASTSRSGGSQVRGRLESLVEQLRDLQARLEL